MPPPYAPWETADEAAAGGGPGAEAPADPIDPVLLAAAPALAAGALTERV